MQFLIAPFLSIQLRHFCMKIISKKVGENSLLSGQVAYKPFRYPWAYEAWLTHERMHWLPDEVPMAEDVKQWNTVLTDAEKNLCTHIFRLFTQQDKDVFNAYVDLYLPTFVPNEVRMMLSGFNNREATHQAAYSTLIDTLGMPETTYSAFLEYKEMADKHDLLDKFNMDSLHDIALSMAIFAAFTEGLQLFASFAVLLNFSRFKKLKDMSQILAWSVRDEAVHYNSIFKLYHAFLYEFGEEIDMEKLNSEIKKYCQIIVENEDRFIDKCFEMGGVEGLGAEDVKLYMRYLADTRLESLKIEPIYNVEVNPLPWVDEIINGVEHVNFFENRSTDYSRGALQGDWGKVFEDEWVLYTRKSCHYCDMVYETLKRIKLPEGIKIRQVEIEDREKRNEFYDQNKFLVANRSMPKLWAHNRWYLTSSDIISMLQIYEEV